MWTIARRRARRFLVPPKCKKFEEKFRTYIQNISTDDTHKLQANLLEKFFQSLAATKVRFNILNYKFQLKEQRYVLNKIELLIYQWEVYYKIRSNVQN